MKDSGRQKDRQRWERKEWASLVEKHPRRVKASPWGHNSAERWLTGIPVKGRALFISYGIPVQICAPLQSPNPGFLWAGLKLCYRWIPLVCDDVQF